MKRIGSALITGGSSGIGLATARKLAGMGHPVALVARDVERLQKAANEIKTEHRSAEVLCIPCDVADAKKVEAAVSAATNELGDLRYLVCSAGVTAPGVFADVPLDTHQTVMSVNYFGTVNTIRAALPHLGPGSQIGIISSAAALTGIYGYSAYAPSKYALRGLAEVLRVELSERKIGVTLCMPPDTNTPQLAGELAHRPEITNRIAAMSAVLEPDAVADVLLKAMIRNRFIAIPSTSLKALHLFSVIANPFMRRLQIELMRRSRTKR